MRTIIIVYGTRPEFLKIKPLVNTIRDAEIPLKVVKVNQHAAFHEDAGYYDVCIEVESAENRIASIGSAILHGLPRHLSSSAVVLVQGDTATAFYAAVAAFQSGVQVIHLEAGMRTYDMANPFPEEGYRQMISRIASLHLCPSLREALTLNMREGVEQDNIAVVGNTILDLVKSYNIPITSGNHVIITLHRRENWTDYRTYIDELAKLSACTPHLQFNFYAHPNPALKVVLNSIELPTNFNIREPLGHRPMIEQLASCAFVITDSGGIQEEANFLGKHMYVLRRCTERSSIDPSKITLIPDPAQIATINCGVIQHSTGQEYGDSNACIEIVKILKERYS